MNITAISIFIIITCCFITLPPLNPLLCLEMSHLYLSKSENNNDCNLDWQVNKLINEIKERIVMLKQKGINEMELKSIFPFNQVELSRLVITKQNQLILPDYDNLEIILHPLPKAVYFLFLNHPEGILFKNLSEYKAELILIYKKLTGRECIADIERSIDDLINPTSNSMNEKCSRIKRAFTTHLDESVAQHYFISGDRAMPKKICLDRYLVIREE